MGLPYTYVNGNPLNLSDSDGHRPVDDFGNDDVPYCEWHQCTAAQQKSGASYQASYNKRVTDEARTERIAELNQEIKTAQIDYLTNLIPSDQQTKDMWRTEGLAALATGDPNQSAAFFAELRTWFTPPPHGSCAASTLCLGVIGAVTNPLTYVPDPSACIGSNSSAGGCALQLASIVPVSKLAKLRLLVESAKEDSTLARASSAAFDAARDADSMGIKNKHLLSAGGNGAKFVTDDIGQVQEWIANGLLSDGVKFLPNQLDDTFRAIVPAGQIVGTRGQTFIRVIISYDGRVINAFPVNTQ